MEEKIIKLMLLCTQIYQEQFDKMRNNMFKQKCDCYKNLSTIQTTPHRMLVEQISKLDVNKISNIQDIVERLEGENKK